MSAAQHSERMSSLLRPDTKSLGRNDGELGDSDGASKRMDIVSGTRDVVSLKMCDKGFMDDDAMERESVGVQFVGGSYLHDHHLINDRRETRSDGSYLAHMTNTLNF